MVGIGTTPRPTSKPTIPNASDTIAVIVARLMILVAIDSFGSRGRKNTCAMPARIRMRLQMMKNLGRNARASMPEDTSKKRAAHPRFARERLFHAAAGELVVKRHQLARDRPGRAAADG